MKIRLEPGADALHVPAMLPNRILERMAHRAEDAVALVDALELLLDLLLNQVGDFVDDEVALPGALAEVQRNACGRNTYELTAVILARLQSENVCRPLNTGRLLGDPMPSCPPPWPCWYVCRGIARGSRESRACG
jgi:hypothetical protein